MKNALRVIAVAALMFAASAGTAHAWLVQGRVICAGNKTALIGVQVIVTSGGVSATAVTDDDGYSHCYGVATEKGD